jgi:hypothetical protein
MKFTKQAFKLWLKSFESKEWVIDEWAPLARRPHGLERQNRGERAAHYGELQLIGGGRSREIKSANVTSDLPRVDWGMVAGLGQGGGGMSLAMAARRDSHRTGHPRWRASREGGGNGPVKQGRENEVLKRGRDATERPDHMHRAAAAHWPLRRGRCSGQTTGRYGATSPKDVLWIKAIHMRTLGRTETDETNPWNVPVPTLPARTADSWWMWRGMV